MGDVGMTDYKDHPPTIGELRSDKTQSCSDWTPRDVLIQVLREIDSGKNIDALVVCWRERIDDREFARYRQSAESGLTTRGLMIDAIVAMH